MLEQVYKENLFIMKLLVTHMEFLEDVKQIRDLLHIPVEGFKSREDKTNWALEWDKQLPPAGIEYFKNPKSIFFNAESLIKKYQLRYNFLPYIEKFILFNEVDAPKKNFGVSLGPDPRGFRSNKWVSIKAYAPLTKNEIREATKELLELQVEFLSPKATLDLRPKIDIDLALEIEREMAKRMKKIEEKPDSYLERVKESYGLKEFERVKKLNPGRIEKIIVKYTSREIAENFFKEANKASLVRKICSSLQKKRKQLFD
jgi:hypothetical protein